MKITFEKLIGPKAPIKINLELDCEICLPNGNGDLVCKNIMWSYELSESMIAERLGTNFRENIVKHAIKDILYDYVDDLVSYAHDYLDCRKLQFLSNTGSGNYSSIKEQYIMSIVDKYYNELYELLFHLRATKKFSRM